MDDVCKAAGFSKGSFFHYFENKEQLALAALDRFVAKMVARVREAVAAKDPGDAYGRICAYCDLIAQVAQVRDAQEGCLIAAFVMESRSEDSVFAHRCAACFGSWIELLKQEFAAALSTRRRMNPAGSAELAQLCICVIEGALILARGRRDARMVASALEHFKRYVGSLREIDRDHRQRTGRDGGSLPTAESGNAAGRVAKKAGGVHRTDGHDRNGPKKERTTARRR